MERKKLLKKQNKTQVEEEEAQRKCAHAVRNQKGKKKKSFLQACGSFNEEVIQGAFSGGGDGGGDAVQIDVSNLG